MNDLCTARSKLATDLTWALEAARLAPASKKPIILCSGPGGLGKSHTTAHLLRHQRVTWMAPKNSAQAEVEAFLDNPLPGVVALPGSGPARPRVQKQIARDDPGACSQRERLDLVVKRGLARFSERLACKRCPDRSSCGYKTWTRSGEWLFAPHTWLGLSMNNKAVFAGCDVIVIDESPLPTMLESVVLQPHEVQLVLAAIKARDTNPMARWAILAPLAAEALTRFFEQVLDLLRTPPPGRKRIALKELASDLSIQFVNRFAGPTTLHLVTTMRGGKRRSCQALREDCVHHVEPSSVQALLQSVDLPAGLVEKVHRLADALAEDEGHRPTCVLVLPDAHRGGAIVAGRFRDPWLPENVPLVILDATTDPVLYEQLFDRPIIQVRAELPQVSRIVQTVDARYPTSTLEDPKSPSVKRLLGIAQRHMRLNPGTRAAAIVKKGTYEKLRAQFDQVFAPGDVHFFWSVRGSNALKDYGMLFVFGAPELPPYEVEGQVRAFMSQVPPDASTRPFDYSPTTFPIATMGEFKVEDAMGEPATLEERCYVGTFEAFVWALFHRDEYMQAILRARPFDPAHPKTIYFFSNLMLGELETELVTEKHLLGEDILVQAAEILRARSDVSNQKELAKLLGVTGGCLSKQKKKHPRYWSEKIAPYVSNPI